MKDIKVYARRLKFICLFLVLPAIVITYILNWCQYSTLSGVNEFVSTFSYSWDYSDAIAQAPFLNKIFMIAIDSVSLILFVLGLVYLVQVLKLYERGAVFTEQTVFLFKKICKIALIYTIYAPIKISLLGLISTLSKPVGQRVLSISFGSNDMLNIFIVGMCFIIVSMLHEGFSIKKDQDLTV